MSAQRRSEFSVAILAAGRSSRMGRPKMLLAWEDTSMVGHLIATWRALGAKQVAVVQAAGDDALRAELERLGFPKKDRIVNPKPARGMFSSVRGAAEWDGWSKLTTHWVMALGDQPHLRRETLEALVDFARRHPEKICQPGRGRHALHPVILPKGHFEKLADTRAKTLKAFLHLAAEDVELMETDDAGAGLDIDWPADYAKARQLDGISGLRRGN